MDMDHRALRLSLPGQHSPSMARGIQVPSHFGAPQQYTVGGSSGSSHPGPPQARGLFMPGPVQRGYELQCPTDAAQCDKNIHKTCSYLEACCRKKPSFVSSNSQWAYVGEGRGGYDKVMQLNYVGEGCGRYADSGQPQTSTSKARAVCTCFAICLAFLVGLSFAFSRCSGGDDTSDFFCGSTIEEAFEAVVKEAKARWAQLSPGKQSSEEYCGQSNSRHPNKEKMDFCCKTSRDLCRLYMTAELKSGLPAADDIDSGSHAAMPVSIADSVTDSSQSTQKPTDMRTSSAPATPPPKLRFNCNTDFATWSTSWSEPQKDWCCRHALRGCADGPPLAGFTTSHGPEKAAAAAVGVSGGGDKSWHGTTEAPLYECVDGPEDDWSVPRKAWCCVHTGSIGCPKKVA